MRTKVEATTPCSSSITWSEEVIDTATRLLLTMLTAFLETSPLDIRAPDNKLRYVPATCICWKCVLTQLILEKSLRGDHGCGRVQGVLAQGIISLVFGADA